MKLDLYQKYPKKKIIIFNEAHHQPSLRVFVSLILRDLFKEGFKYIFTGISGCAVCCIQHLFHHI